MVGACRLANLRQQAALGSAAAAMSSWDKHIEAMNLLVAGKISLAVATDFWESSRVGASQGLSDFRGADRTYALSSSGRCAPLEGPAAAAAPATAVVAVRQCSAALGLGDAALARARPALSTWEHHIHDMDALLAGRITPGQAVAMWQHSWRAGNAQLKAYRTSVDSNGRSEMHARLDERRQRECHKGQNAQAPERRKAPTAEVGAFLESMSGCVLLSHTVTSAVPSALKGLASGFGMGPGVSPSL